jgi:ABC-type nitrate/sulfonate/bicarbonate transport system substrate-binding protein
MRRSLTYGVPTDRCGLQLRLGIEKGFFREQGIELEVRTVFVGPEIAAELDAGRLPIGELGTPPGLTAMANGARFKIVGSSVRRGAVLYFVVRKQLSTFNDLKQARLGVLSSGSCSDWYTRELLRSRGLDPDSDVTIVGLGQRSPQVVELLGAGDLDGAMISEPQVSRGEKAGYFNVWLGMNSCDFAPPMQWTIMVAHNDLLLHGASLIRAFLSACRRSYRYAVEHRDEWADFGADYFRTPRGIMVKSIERELPDLHFDCEVDVEGLAAAIALQQRLGSVPGSLRFERCPRPALHGRCAAGTCELSKLLWADAGTLQPTAQAKSRLTRSVSIHPRARKAARYRTVSDLRPISSREASGRTAWLGREGLEPANVIFGKPLKYWPNSQASHSKRGQKCELHGNSKDRNVQRMLDPSSSPSANFAVSTFLQWFGRAQVSQ